MPGLALVSPSPRSPITGPSFLFPGRSPPSDKIQSCSATVPPSDLYPILTPPSLVRFLLAQSIQLAAFTRHDVHCKSPFFLGITTCQWGGIPSATSYQHTPHSHTTPVPYCTFMTCAIAHLRYTNPSPFQFHIIALSSQPDSNSVFQLGLGMGVDIAYPT